MRAGTGTIEHRLFSGNKLRRLIVPLIIEQGLAIAVGMADTIMISAVSESAVSGVSLVDMVNIIIINIFSALATGGAVVVAQFIGAEKPEKVRDSVQQLLMVSFCISLFLMGALLLLRKPIMHTLFGKIEPDVWDHAMQYLWVTALSFPFIALYNAGAALFRAIGNSRVSMLTSFISNIVNVVGNAVFLFLCHWGVFGVAFSTLIARGVAMVIILILLTRKNQPITWNWRQRYRPNGELIHRILTIGIPNALENSVFQLGKLVIMSIVAAFGTAQITANAIGNNFSSLGAIPGSAMGLAILTVIGQCVGAQDEEQIYYYTKKLLKLTYLIGGIVNALILVTLPITIHLYDVSAETAALAMKLVWIHDGFAILFWPASFALPNALRAANDVRSTMVVSIFSMIVFRVLFSYILGQWLQMGVIGVWIAMIIDWVFRCFVFVFRVCGKKWIRKALDSPENTEKE